MNAQQTLEKYGFESREASIYLNLIKSGISTANQISKETTILRQTVYEIINKLISKGVVVTTIKNNVKYFEAKDPEILNTLLEEKKELVDNILPELKILSKQNYVEHKVELFEGVSGIKAIYKQLVEDKPKELLELGNTKYFQKILEFYFVQNYMLKRITNKTKLRLITEPDNKNKELYGTNNKAYRKTKYHQKLYDTKTATYIYNNKVIMLTFEEKPTGIIIENKEFATTQKILFEELWKNSVD